MVVISMGLVVAACGEPKEDEPKELAEREAAMRIMVDALEVPEVDRVRWTVTSCDGTVELMDEDDDVDRWTHEVAPPSHILSFDLFMERYLEVPAGCWDVAVRLLNPRGEPVSDCSMARGAQVEVAKDETADLVLFSRCDGVEYEPKVEMLRFEPSAAVECGEEIEVCGTVNSDGLSVILVWRRVGEVPLAQPLETMQIQEFGGRVEQCASWVPKHHGETQGRLRAISGTAEVMDGGDTVLFGNPHDAWFSTFMDCPD